MQANFTVLCVIETELLPIEDCGDRDFRPFCPRDLELDPITFIYELDPYSLDMYRMSENKILTSRLSKLSSDRQTETPWKLYTNSLNVQKSITVNNHNRKGNAITYKMTS